MSGVTAVHRLPIRYLPVDGGSEFAAEFELPATRLHLWRGWGLHDVPARGHIAGSKLLEDRAGHGAHVGGIDPRPRRRGLETRTAWVYARCSDEADISITWI